MAVKHMEKEPNEIIIQTSQIWKNKMARIELEVQAQEKKLIWHLINFKRAFLE